MWPLKTLSDPQRNRVNLHPRATTSPAINKRRPQAVVGGGRDAFERQVWRVNAQIVEYKLEADQDIHLVLFGQGAYLIAEMPATSCLQRLAIAGRSSTPGTRSSAGAAHRATRGRI